jgi:hypothetical protein
MGLKIVIPIGYQRVKKISLTAMPLGEGFRERQKELKVIPDNKH